MKLNTFIVTSATLAVTGWALLDGTASAASCPSLVDVPLDSGTVASSALVAAGTFDIAAIAPGTRVNPELARALAALPAFCRATAVLRPSRDSEIRIEVWLPEQNWNGKLQAVGNGAWAGSISYGALAGALADGYAAASTDTGHSGNVATFAVGHPDKLIDFAYRAIHEMTDATKRLVEARYASAPERSYFVGCSTGGRQALAEAQRYPTDYDGIVAGAAAYHPTHLQGAQIWTARIGYRASGAALSAEQLPLIHAATIAACDRLDGIEDGVLENPPACAFDPGSLVCASQSGGACLTGAQAATVRYIYSGPATAAGERLFPGLARGSELGWGDRVTGEPIALATETYRYLVFDDPDWDVTTFDAERDIAAAVATIGPVMNSIDADLTPFFGRGGKLILYHGWDDAGIPPYSTIDYFERVRATVDPQLADAGMRLFMVPGMGHCRGGIGTDRFDAVAALDRWVGAAEPPARIDASRVEDGATVRTRPLCPYPATAVYTGQGNTDVAANFDCRDSR
jgi:Tannase and feruloyl esterase